MLLVKTYLDRSPIHGVGVFAAQMIREGTKIWEFTARFDQIITPDDLSTLTEIQRETILVYGYRETNRNQLVLCCDNTRFFNYSRDPNTVSRMDPNDLGIAPSYAVHDIREGEELTFSIDEDLDARLKLHESVYQALVGKE